MNFDPSKYPPLRGTAYNHDPVPILLGELEIFEIPGREFDDRLYFIDRTALNRAFQLPPLLFVEETAEDRLRRQMRMFWSPLRVPRPACTFLFHVRPLSPRERWRRPARKGRGPRRRSRR